MLADVFLMPLKKPQLLNPQFVDLRRAESLSFTFNFQKDYLFE